MRQKLEGIELFRDIGKAMAPLIFVFLGCLILFGFFLDYVIPWEKPAAPPEFTFSNAGPCLGLDRKRVERFEVGDEQYICADMKVDRAEVNLDFYVHKNENKDQVYVSRDTFTSGPIAFYVKPLPPGKYLARINWTRTTLVEFEFEVIEKSDQ